MGFLNWLGLTKPSVNASKNVTLKNVNANKNASVAPLNNTTILKPNQMGGMAPVNAQYPSGMQQPSEVVMKWATTAGAPMPPESEMRGVAHGGKRRTHKQRVHKSKSVHKRRATKRRAATGGKHQHRKTHRRSCHHKRRN